MSLVSIAENIYIQNHPLSLLGCQMGRVVTLIKLESGQVLIHSTADFQESDLNEILDLGQPCGVFEATNFHDTYTKACRTTFPDLPYYVPSGFANRKALGARDVSEFQADEEVRILKVEGIPKLNEFSVFHEPSKTLIIADLFFNFPDTAGRWTKWFLKTAARLNSFPGQSAFFQRFIEDEVAFRHSIREIAELDFDKIIVGHGDPIREDAKNLFRKVLLP